MRGIDGNLLTAELNYFSLITTILVGGIVSGVGPGPSNETSQFHYSDSNRQISTLISTGPSFVILWYDCTIALLL